MTRPFLGVLDHPPSPAKSGFFIARLSDKDKEIEPSYTTNNDNQRTCRSRRMFCDYCS